MTNINDDLILDSLLYDIAYNSLDWWEAAGDSMSIPLSYHGGDPMEMYRVLADVANSEGLPINIQSESPDGARGAYLFPKRGAPSHARPFITIWTQGQTEAQLADTLMHELCHHFTPGLLDLGVDDGRNRDAEIIAESAAYIVGRHLGFDTRKWSAVYVLDWSQGNLQRVQGHRARILETAARMLTAVERHYKPLEAAA